MTRASLRVLGVDPGSRKAGWGVIEVERGRRALNHVDNGVIMLDERAPLAARLFALGEGLERAIADTKPDVAVVEDVFVKEGARSALILGQARGAALLALARAGLVAETLNTVVVKQAVTGSGRATKEQVAHMVVRELSLKELPFEDAADALALALAFAVRATAVALAPSTTTRAQRARGGRRASFAALARAQGKL